MRFLGASRQHILQNNTAECYQNHWKKKKQNTPKPKWIDVLCSFEFFNEYHGVFPVIDVTCEGGSLRCMEA